MMPVALNETERRHLADRGDLTPPPAPRKRRDMARTLSPEERSAVIDSLTSAALANKPLAPFCRELGVTSGFAFHVLKTKGFVRVVLTEEEWLRVQLTRKTQQRKAYKAKQTA